MLKLIWLSVKTHRYYGVNVKLIDDDLEFISIQFRMLINRVQAPWNKTHNGLDERSITFSNEILWCAMQSLPFECVPKALIFGTVCESILIICRHPRKNGVLNILNTLTIETNNKKLN